MRMVATTSVRRTDDSNKHLRGKPRSLKRAQPQGASSLVARLINMAAFGRRCIPPPPQRGSRVGGPGAGCVAPPSDIPDILGRRALPAGRRGALGASPYL